MPSRQELELRAGAVDVDVTTYPNDSDLEQAVLYAEQHLTASSTATTLAPSATNVAAESGAADL